MAKPLRRASGAARYRLTVAGHLDPAWSDWFAGCTITAQPAGVTEIEVDVIDQAALYGLLARARDLGLTLISLRRVARRQNQRGQ